MLHNGTQEDEQDTWAKIKYWCGKLKVKNDRTQALQHDTQWGHKVQRYTCSTSAVIHWITTCTCTQFGRSKRWWRARRRRRKMRRRKRQWGHWTPNATKHLITVLRFQKRSRSQQLWSVVLEKQLPVLHEGDQLNSINWPAELTGSQRRNLGSFWQDEKK